MSVKNGSTERGRPKLVMMILAFLRYGPANPARLVSIYHL